MKKRKLSPFLLHEIKVFLAFLTIILIIEFIPEIYSFSGMSTLYLNYYANRTWFQFWFLIAAVYFIRLIYVFIIKYLQKK